MISCDTIFMLYVYIYIDFYMYIDFGILARLSLIHIKHLPLYRLMSLVIKYPKYDGLRIIIACVSFLYIDGKIIAGKSNV